MERPTKGKLIYQTTATKKRLNNLPLAVALLVSITLLGGLIQVFGEGLVNPILFGIVLVLLLALPVVVGIKQHSKNQVVLSFYREREGIFGIEAEGVDLDYTLRGVLEYESWRMLHNDSYSGVDRNIPYLSIVGKGQAQLLLGASVYNDYKHNDWGILRGASAYPIGLSLKMSIKELILLRDILRRAAMPEIQVVYRNL